MDRTKSLGNLFVLVSLFPWVSFGIVETEIQVWPVFWAIIFMISSLHSKFPVKLIVFFGGIPLVVIAGFFSSDAYLMMRALFAAAGFSIIFIAYYVYFSRFGFPVLLFLAGNFLYLIVAVAQVFYGAEITEWIVSSRTSEDRGVVSLTPEPTYFGLCLLIFSWIYFIYYNYKLSKTIALVVFVNFLFIVFVAKSAMALLYSVVFFAGYFLLLYRARSILLIFVFCAFLFFIFYFDFLIDGSRLNRLISIFMDNPMNLLLEDASINERFKNAFYPFVGLYHNNFLPGGYGSFLGMHDFLDEFYGGFFWYGEGGERYFRCWGQ